MKRMKKLFGWLAPLLVLVLTVLWRSPCAQAQVTPPQTILRVDGVAGSAMTANPPPTGSAWGSVAFKYLRDAIAAAPAHDPPVAIWVRGSTPGNPVVYRADQGQNVTPNSRSETFPLVNLVRWYGGFAGTEAPSEFNLRQPYQRPTVLSGDIGIASDRTDNTFHIVTGIDVSTTAIVDGFTIRDGYAWDDLTNYSCGMPGGEIGGGMLLIGHGATSQTGIQPTILRCTFLNNEARLGGGVFLRPGTQMNFPKFYNCRYIGNRAGKDDPNLTSGEGAAMYVMEFTSPCEEQYGEISINVAAVVNSLFDSNWAENSGAAVYCNCLQNVVSITNSTIVRNTGKALGVTLLHLAPNDCQPGHGGFSLTNTLIWDNHCGPQGNCPPSTWEWISIFGAREMHYCDMQNLDPNGTPANCLTNSFDLDPRFLDAAGDFRLRRGSPCIDHGNPLLSAIPVDYYDLDQDTDYGERTPDLLGLMRVACTRPEIGCYERQLQVCPGDATDDGVVNVNDLLVVINSWGPCPLPPSGCAGDLDPVCGDAAVNVNDLLVVINSWGCGATPESMPQSVQDCMDLASEQYEAFSPEWNAFVNKCVQALCEAHIINCN